MQEEEAEKNRKEKNELLFRPNLVGRQVQVLIKLGTETSFFSPLWVTKNEV